MAQESLGLALLLATLAGASIPLGGWIASFPHLVPGWMEEEFRHSVTAFGGGVLMSAVALVLVPEGSERVPATAALVSFAAGGILFFLLDRAIERNGGRGAQLMAMLLDFLPESLALGALLAGAPELALLLATMIALQNLPEGFNAYRELRLGTSLSKNRILGLFLLIVLIGPLTATIGLLFLEGAQGLLGSIMLFAAGGILYLVFEDIAPQVPLKENWGPPLGAVGGFLLGFAGQLALH
ncbi:MAG TPA: divalent cation transporter [Rhodobacteraceae bacterium]|nr:divalent cation transporter [Paracoccaceae bacterium]